MEPRKLLSELTGTTRTPPFHAPTSQLPPIAKIRLSTVKDLEDAMLYLRVLYNPEVRAMRRIRKRTYFPIPTIPSDSGVGTDNSLSSESFSSSAFSSIPEETSADVIRSDEFERSYAMKWLTALVSQSELLHLSDDTEDSDHPSEDPLVAQDITHVQWERLIQDAAALLAICAGTASAGTLSRTFIFPARSGIDIKVQVTDVPLENSDFSSVGAQTWASARVLAEMIVDSPGNFGLKANRPLRILELGAGTGLVSIVVGKVLQSMSTSSPVSLIATDFHPAVLKNLQGNLDDNLARSPTLSTHVHFLDWATFPDGPPTAPFDEPFDIVFGSDLIYDGVEQARWIRQCLELLLRRPSSLHYEAGCLPRFHLTIPLRSTHTVESRSVEEVFPMALPGPSATSVGLSLAISRKEATVCEAERNHGIKKVDDGELEYLHYVVSWCQTP